MDPARRAGAPPGAGGAAVPTDLWTFMHPSTSWPWYLLFGTMALALGTVGTAIYLTTMPARAAQVPTAAACQVATATLAPGCRPS